MILQALNAYYRRMQEAHPGELAEFGFERKHIPVIMEITKDGELHQIHIDTDKNSQVAYVLPKAIKKTSGVAANLLWDNAEYALGLVRPDGKPDRVAQQHQAFTARLQKLDSDDIGLSALKTFLANLDIQKIQERGDWNAEFMQTNPNVTFKLLSDTELICERKNLRQSIVTAQQPADAKEGLCLMTAEHESLERLHPSIKGVWGAQSSGANIVSFNQDSFESFGKEQGNNSPVGIQSAFQYTESLNYLLRKGSRQRTQVGDASTVFWSEKGNTEIENAFSLMMSNPEKENTKDDPNANVKKVKSALNAFYTGTRVADSDNQRFYVLGLAPNASRIAVRFWKISTIRKISVNITQHFADIAITHPAQEIPEIPLPRLLSHLCLEYKLKNLPPNVVGEVIRSIIENQPYPYTLLGAAIRRNKAEQKVTFPRAAIIKACLNRYIRYQSLPLLLPEEEFNMALDRENTDIAYVLGRWFATLEKIQEESHPGINATIKDRYYGAISSNPVNVFSVLDRLKNHHLAKLEKKYSVPKEKLLGEIVGKLPPHLPHRFSLPEQGSFSIGYYHQRQDFFTSKKSDEEKAQS